MISLPWGTLKSLLHYIESIILWHSAFIIGPSLHPLHDYRKILNFNSHGLLLVELMSLAFLIFLLWFICKNFSSKAASFKFSSLRSLSYGFWNENKNFLHNFPLAPHHCKVMELDIHHFSFWIFEFKLVFLSLHCHQGLFGFPLLSTIEIGIICISGLLVFLNKIWILTLFIHYLPWCTLL